MLARFGYEDRSFTLEIPSDIEEEQETCEGETFELSFSAFNFLQNLALHAPLRRAQDSEIESINPTKLSIPSENVLGNIRGNVLSWEDLSDILSVMPSVSHPWSYPPICQVYYFIHYFIFCFNHYFFCVCFFFFVYFVGEAYNSLGRFCSSF